MAAPTPAVTMSAEQFTEFMQKFGNRTDDDNPKLTDALLKLADAHGRTVRQSNSWHPDISPFSYPEGNLARPKPKLDRETWFCASKQDESMLTPREIEAFNLITVSKHWRGDPTFGATITPQRRLIMLPHASIDDRMNLPGSLLLILLELMDGPDAVQPGQMADELVALRAQVRDLAALVGATTPAPVAQPIP
jgi:hypothetical protein